MATEPQSPVRAAIPAEHLVRRFGGFTAVNDVTFRVEKGEIFGFLGPNGSGKTTVIKMLTGLLPLSGGSAHVEGLDVRTDSEAVRERIGYMSQNFSLYYDLTVEENLKFYGRIYSLEPARLKRRMEEIIQLNGLGPYLKRLAAQLWDLLFELSGHGITFFVTTHYMDEAERCSHVAYIYYGKLIADGTPDSLRQLPEVQPDGTRRVEFTAPEVTRALRLARGIPGIRSATIFGQSVHALVDENLSLDGLRRELAENGIAVDEIRPLAPSLEDVFVELTYKQESLLEAASD